MTRIREEEEDRMYERDRQTDTTDDISRAYASHRIAKGYLNSEPGFSFVKFSSAYICSLC